VATRLKTEYGVLAPTGSLCIGIHDIFPALLLTSYFAILRLEGIIQGSGKEEKEREK